MNLTGTHVRCFGSNFAEHVLFCLKVGKGLSKDGKAHKLAFQHWIEAVIYISIIQFPSFPLPFAKQFWALQIDPRHRYGHNLHLYYEQWCQGDAGQPFFYWSEIISPLIFLERVY